MPDDERGDREDRAEQDVDQPDAPGGVPRASPTIGRRSRHADGFVVHPGGAWVGPDRRWSAPCIAFRWVRTILSWFQSAGDYRA